MTSLIERRRLALSDIFSARNRLYEMKVAYEAGFAKVSEMEMPASIPLSFSPQPPINTTSRVFEHREILGKGDTAEDALADWLTPD